MGVEAARERMFAGEKINFTEVQFSVFRLLILILFKDLVFNILYSRHLFLL